ncbi:hypothetical protein SAMN05216203_1494 [Marinobacter daqiaonensis]|uniref:Uncharacterized protein n=1 Tax=Marinobacter daqiaonensis TaxID=650891 RepID=A0A1I6HSL1_9GAMM|nr:hypothetical protein [Marinobacter daqiaonensis]SFR57414.1 hypothetical protein SAMN05216203_1494 [Marinobacter daqiaonensis]
MIVWNHLTNRSCDLTDDEALQWDLSCTAWTIVKPSISRSTINPSDYKLENVVPESLNLFWNNNLAFTRSVMIARALASSLHQFEISNIIWTQSVNNSYMMAVIEWCKAFGSNNEEVHWKRVFGENSPYMSDLLSELDLSHDEYEQYWKKMTDARSKRIAHSNLDGEKVIELPELDTAIFMARSTHRILNLLLPHLSKVKGELFTLNPICFDVWKDNFENSLGETISPAIATAKGPDYPS